MITSGLDALRFLLLFRLARQDLHGHTMRIFDLSLLFSIQLILFYAQSSGLASVWLMLCICSIGWFSAKKQQLPIGEGDPVLLMILSLSFPIDWFPVFFLGSSCGVIVLDRIKRSCRAGAIELPLGSILISLYMALFLQEKLLLWMSI
jgi:hypothetical protein